MGVNEIVSPGFVDDSIWNILGRHLAKARQMLGSMKVSFQCYVDQRISIF